MGGRGQRLREHHLRGRVTVVTVPGSQVVLDGITEWWISPVATTLTDPDLRTVFGCLSSSGKIVAGSFNHATGQATRVNVAQAVSADDHNSPALWAMAGHRFVIAWTGHNADNYVHLRVSDVAETLATLQYSPETLLDLG